MEKCRAILIASRILGAAAMAAATLACDATAPSPPVLWAESAFGADAVAWAVEDTIGAGFMRPVLDSGHVYVERRQTSLGGALIPSRLMALDRSTGRNRWSIGV